MPRYPSSLWDFTQYFDQFKRLHTRAFFQGQYEMMYPTPMVVWYRILYALQPVAKLSMIVIILALPAIASWMVARALVRQGMRRLPAAALMIATYICSYPLWFELKQGNLEIIVWLLVSLGIFAAYHRRGYTAAGLFGVVGSMKFYPIIYLGLLLSRRKYRECIFGVLVCGASTLGGLWFVGPTIRAAWDGTSDGMALSQRDYLLVRRPKEVGFDHSLFGVLKAFIALLRHTRFLPHPGARSVSPHVLTVYLLTVSLIGLVLYLWKIRKLPFTNQVLCLTVASILLPPMSFDYTLLHVYAPISLVLMATVKANKEGSSVKGLTLLLVLLALSIGPLSELILLGERFGGEFRAFILLSLFTVGMVLPVQAHTLPEPASNA